jgi:hypothetical protein
VGVQGHAGVWGGGGGGGGEQGNNKGRRGAWRAAGVRRGVCMSMDRHTSVCAALLLLQLLMLPLLLLLPLANPNTSSSPFAW